MFKRLIILHFISLFLIGMSSCTQEGAEPISTQKKPIKLDMVIANDFTRAIADENFQCSFEDGDEVGVFGVMRIVPLVPAYPYPTGNYMHNIKYTYNKATSTWETSGGEEYYYPLNGYPIDFYAYYPYKENVNPRSISYTIEKECDLMTARSQGFNNESTGKPVLQFSHKLALTQLQVENADIFESLECMMTFVLPEATLNLGASNQSSELTTRTSATEDLEINIEMKEISKGLFRIHIPPQSFTLGNPLFILTAENRSFVINSAQSVPYLAGYAYVYNINLIP